MFQLRWYQEEAVESLFSFYSIPRELQANGLPNPKNAIVALPTGSGKSLVIAEFFRRAIERFPNTRAVMSTHVKELIKQNAAKLQEVWPLAPLGIYSAGLKSRDQIQPLIFGGIQSMVGKKSEYGHNGGPPLNDDDKTTIFGFRDFLVIDEAHLVGTDSDTRYLTFIDELRKVNPYLKIILLTATPYRAGLGHLTNGDIATDTVYDLCNIEGFSRLMVEGFLSPLIAFDGAIPFDTSNLGVSGQDFNQTQVAKVFDDDAKTYEVLKECYQKAYNRRSWLIFASSVRHAERIGEMLNHMGISTVVTHSKKTEAENDEAIKLWKAGVVRCAVNMGKLTTGVDNPMCDFIAILRATMSTGLWVQMLGRGTRCLYAPGFDLGDFSQRWQAIRASGKENCLVLDYGGNAWRLGPINDPLIPRPKGQGTPGDAPLKKCPTCGAQAHMSQRTCIPCGYVFSIFDANPNLANTAGTHELIRSDLPEIKTFQVDKVVHTPHVRKITKDQNPGTSPDLLPYVVQATYYCGMKVFRRYLNVEPEPQIDGTVRLTRWNKTSRDWFRQRFPYNEAPPWAVTDFSPDVPPTNARVLELSSHFIKPTSIEVWIN